MCGTPSAGDGILDASINPARLTDLGIAKMSFAALYNMVDMKNIKGCGVKILDYHALFSHQSVGHYWNSTLLEH